MRAIRFLFSGFALCALAVVWAACGGSEQAAPLPNIVVILADDMGYGDPGASNPDSKVPTPHIDRLAAEGMRFTDAHSPSAVCTPTRYGLLTGRYAWRTHLKRGVLVGYSPNLIDTTRLTLPGMLRQAGYATAGIGKWHLGLGDAERTDYAQPLRPGPVSLGFDYYFGIPSSLDFEPYVWFENDRVEQLPTDSIEASRPCCKEDFYRGGGIAPDFRHVDVLPRTVEKSVEYVMQAGDKPFFLYVPFSAPHTPWLPTEPFLGSSGAGTYGDFAVQVDAGVGDILNALDEAGVAENTLVVFTSDNGAHWLPYEIEMFDHRANLDWRGMKADIYEGGHRVPFVARWPGRIEAGSVSHELISLVDLMATFASVTGQMLPDDAGEDSYNLTPVLLGESLEGPIREATVHHSVNGTFAIRQGSWKLIEGLGSGGFTQPVSVEPGPGDPPGQLYHLGDDPGETNNLYAEHPEVVERLSALLARYREQGYSRPMTGAPAQH
ncbi:MAG: arylsulfatase [Bacteroidetes bacterium SB0662_bin_6]|nr:arylsulfatase [Bacteroidetes bacterium SB0668_bin_1]MYE04795.1 arylsulfatase [Bacteroidetes bacterium SB0662_bin_6]